MCGLYLCNNWLGTIALTMEQNRHGHIAVINQINRNFQIVNCFRNTYVPRIFNTYHFFLQSRRPYGPERAETSEEKPDAATTPRSAVADERVRTATLRLQFVFPT